MYPDSILHWIDDAEVPSSGNGAFEKRCPMDDRVVARVVRGTAADVNVAVGAALRAANGSGV